MHRFQLIEVACIKYGFIEDFMTKSLALIKNKNKTATLKKKKKLKVKSTLLFQQKKKMKPAGGRTTSPLISPFP